MSVPSSYVWAVHALAYPESKAGATRAARASSWQLRAAKGWSARAPGKGNSGNEARLRKRAVPAIKAPRLPSREIARSSAALNIGFTRRPACRSELIRIGQGPQAARNVTRIV